MPQTATHLSTDDFAQWLYENQPGWSGGKPPYHWSQLGRDNKRPYIANALAIIGMFDPARAVARDAALNSPLIDEMSGAIVDETPLEEILDVLRRARHALIESQAIEGSLGAALERATAAKARADTTITEIQKLYSIQCPPKRSTFGDTERGEGSFIAHKWWSNVLGGELRRYAETEERIQRQGSVNG